jgi:hypothetical protein
MTPRVTVGILSWNRKDALRIALDSVRRQTIFSEAEVVAIDNASRDGTREMLRSDYPWAKLVEREANSGLAEGRNMLVRLARAPIVFWMDDDCELIEDHCLEALVRKMEANPEIAVVFARILEGDDGKAHAFPPEDAVLRQVERQRAFPATFSSGGTCVRNPQFLEIGGYDPDFFRMAVENAFSYKVFRAGSWIEYDPSVTLVHRPHQFGRNFRVIAYYGTRNCLLGYWRYLPLGAAAYLTCLEMVARPLGAIPCPDRFVGVLCGLAAAIWRIPKCLLRERRPMDRPAFSRWAHCRHYLVRSIEDRRRIPDRYPFGEFMAMEFKVRFLRRIGWSRSHLFIEEPECIAVRKRALEHT